MQRYAVCYAEDKKIATPEKKFLSVFIEQQKILLCFRTYNSTGTGTQGWKH